MFHKIQTIKQTLFREKLDLLLLTETELNENHDLSLMSIQGYDLLTPPNKVRSRIAAYVKTNLKYQLNNSNQNVETISITINELKVLGIYRTFLLPNHNNATDQMRDIIDEIDDHDIVLGDLNLDSNKKGISSYRYSNIYELWSSKMESSNLRQVNDRPTWYRIVNNIIRESCLDHIYVKPQITKFELIQKTSSSDHDLLGIKLGDFSPKKSFSSTFYVRKWSQYSPNLVQNECEKID